MRTLLTGFGPFGEVVNNPSARIVEHFARAGAAGHDLTTRVLPVSYTRAEREIRELLLAESFDAALLLGVAGREAHLCLEQCARWQGAERADSDGCGPAPRVGQPGLLDRYSATIALQPLLAALLAAGFPARLSDDAGSYVCNHTYFAALHAIAAENLPTRWLFLHVPAGHEAFSEPVEGPAMPLRHQIEAVAHVLAWLGRSEPPLRPSDGSQ